MDDLRLPDETDNVSIFVININIMNFNIIVNQIRDK